MRDRLAAVAEWTAAAARDNALVRAVLTGSERLPSLTLSAVPSSSAVPAQRRADGPLPSPADLVALVRDRAVTVLGRPGTARADALELARCRELAVRVAPAASRPRRPKAGWPSSYGARGTGRRCDPYDRGPARTDRGRPCLSRGAPHREAVRGGLADTVSGVASSGAPGSA